MIQGRLCRLRPWRIEDAEALTALANNRRVWRNLTDIFPHPYTQEDAYAWLREQSSDKTANPGAPGPSHFALEVDGVLAGALGFQRREDINRKTLSLGYWLGDPFWGRGIMTDAVRHVLPYAFTMDKVARVQAGIFAWNPASTRVVEKAGFSFEGRLRNAVFKDGEMTDLLYYGILPSEVQKP